MCARQPRNLLIFEDFYNEAWVKISQTRSEPTKTVFKLWNLPKGKLLSVNYPECQNLCHVLFYFSLHFESVSNGNKQDIVWYVMWMILICSFLAFGDDLILTFHIDKFWTLEPEPLHLIICDANLSFITYLWGAVAVVVTERLSALQEAFKIPLVQDCVCVSNAIDIKCS